MTDNIIRSFLSESTRLWVVNTLEETSDCNSHFASLFKEKSLTFPKAEEAVQSAAGPFPAGQAYVPVGLQDPIDLMIASSLCPGSRSKPCLIEQRALLTSLGVVGGRTLSPQR